MTWRVLRLTALLSAAVLLASAAAISSYGLSDRLAPAEALIVPGNTVHADGSLSPRLRARLDAARRAYDSGCCRRIIVSGAVGVEGHDEAEAMRQYLLAQGIDPAAVVQDSAGATTRATALNAAALLGSRPPARVIVATQFFHVARTCLLARAAGLEVVGHVHARFFEPRDVYSLLREIAALAHAGAREMLSRL